MTTFVGFLSILFLFLGLAFDWISEDCRPDNEELFQGLALACMFLALLFFVLLMLPVVL